MSIELLAFVLLAALCVAIYVDFNWARWRRGEFPWRRRR